MVGAVIDIIELSYKNYVDVSNFSDYVYRATHFTICSGVADPLKHALSHMCYHAKFGLRSNIMGVSNEVPKIWKRCGPPWPLG